MSISDVSITSRCEAGSMPRIALAGLNYRNTAIDVRERFNVGETEWPGHLKSIIELPDIAEAVLVSTCNRVELVAAASDREDFNLTDSVCQIFEQFSGVSRNIFREQLYMFEGRQAIDHLFRVASGLDSMVVGEPQILGQLKDSYRIAQDAGTTKAYLNRLFHRAFRAAKYIRTNTGIGKNAVSVCFAARELAGHIFGDLEDASVLLIGAGEIGELAFKHFIAAGVKRVFICNRTLGRALTLAERYNAVALGLDKLEQVLFEVDIVIGASTVTEDSGPILTKDSVEEAQKRRRNEPQFFIDLGVPRNFSPLLNDIEDVFLYNIDHLDEVVKNNLDSRALEVKRAELLINEQVDGFCDWLKSRALEPHIVGIKELGRAIDAAELERTIRRLRREGVGEADLEIITTALSDHTQAVLAKMLHPTFETIKRQGPRDEAIVSLIQQLFPPKEDR